jgi:hypothetical protein
VTCTFVVLSLTFAVRVYVDTTQVPLGITASRCAARPPHVSTAAGARSRRAPRDVNPGADDDWLRAVPALSAYERS